MHLVATVPPRVDKFPPLSGKLPKSRRRRRFFAKNWQFLPKIGNFLPKICNFWAKMPPTSLHLMSFLVQVHWRHFGPKHLILVAQIPQESKNWDIGDFRRKIADFRQKLPIFGINRWFLAKNRRRDFGDFPAGGGGNLSTLGGTVAQFVFHVLFWRG